MAYSMEEVFEASAWNRYFSLASFQHMTQSWAFGEAKRSTGWKPRRFVIRWGAQVVAICQVLYKTVAGIQVLARINQGPMVLLGYEFRELEVHRAIRQRWRFWLRGALLISPAMQHSHEAVTGLKAMGFKQRGDYGWASSRLDLTRSEDDLFTGLDSGWRRNLRKSRANGLSVTVDNDIQWMVAKHVQNMAEKDYEGPAAELVKGLHAASPEDFLVFKVMHEGIAVAGMTAFRFGNVAHYYIGWFGAEGRDLKAGNFLFWEVAMELKRRGCLQFDLGGFNALVGFGRFKAGMNGAGYRSAGEYLCI